MKANCFQIRNKKKFHKENNYLKHHIVSSCGFTIVELMISTIVMVLAAFVIGAVIVDGQNGFSHMYDRIHSDVVSDGYVARKKFDSIIRMASSDKIFIGDDGSSVEVYYYANSSSTEVDRYVRFYASGGDLDMIYGQLNPKSSLGSETICQNVSSCVFKQVGRSIEMILELDNGQLQNTIVTSAVTHN